MRFTYVSRSYLVSKQPRRTKNTGRQRNVGTAESVSVLLSQRISLFGIHDEYIGAKAVYYLDTRAMSFVRNLPNKYNM